MKLNVKLQLTVSPNDKILNFIANTWYNRATLHTDHRLMIESIGLTRDNVKSYFHDLVLKAAKFSEDMRTGEKNELSFLRKLYVPAAFGMILNGIGDVSTPEYDLNVVHSENPYELDDKKMLEISGKFLAIRDFEPSENNQFGYNTLEGDECMFAIVDESYLKLESGQSALRKFTGKSIDDAFLAATAVVGLKPVSTDTKLLYPTIGVIEHDNIVTLTSAVKAEKVI